MAPDGDLSLAVLQGVKPPAVGYYQVSLPALAFIAYSRCSRAMAQYNGIGADLSNSLKDRRTMKSNRLAVFTTSLQCTDEAKVASRSLLFSSQHYQLRQFSGFGLV